MSRKITVLVRYRSLINALAGFIVGFALTCHVRLFWFVADRGCSFEPSQKTQQEASKYSSFVIDNLEEAWLSNNITTGSSLLFVGIMTAQKYLDSRSLSIHRTWAREVPGRYAFFSSSSSSYGLPLVPLPTVDDQYPPQKKSFLMLKFMHDHYIDKFEWFLRADDDVFVNMDKLEAFLRSLDSSKELFIGQAGVGNKEELGQLSLDPDENFCMGGPGVIISRAALARMIPHVEYCLKHLYSTHEDVEIGRCMRKSTGLTCTWAFEMQTIFYHNFSGEINMQHPMFDTIFRDAITLHPIKISQSMYQLYGLYLKEQHSKLRLRQSQLHREILTSKVGLSSPNYSLDLNPSIYGNSSVLGQSLETTFADDLLSRDDLAHWSFIYSKSIYSPDHSNPRRQLAHHTRLALERNILTLMTLINKFSTKNYRMIDFRRLYYGYVRSTRKGVSYIVDLLMDFKQFQGKKMTIPVRRHAYAIQTFGQPYIRELAQQDPMEVVNIVLPLCGRVGPFERFVANFAEVYKADKRISLAVVLFPDAAQSDLEFALTKQIISEQSQAGIPIRIAQLGGHFSRAAALQRGSALFSKESLLLFMDVDILFTHQVIQRVRQSTIRGLQVYYPIVFSQYDPKFVPEYLQNTLKLSEESGYWRQFGYGIVSLYNQDLQAVGGMNIAILGWGQEDVDLFDRFVRSNMTVFRAVDKNLIHVYHQINCSPSLPASQFEMCTGTKLNSFGSVESLARYVIDRKLVP